MPAKRNTIARKNVSHVPAPAYVTEAKMVPIVRQAMPGSCEAFLLVVCKLVPLRPRHTTPNFEEVEARSLTLPFGVTEPVGAQTDALLDAARCQTWPDRVRF